MFPAIVFKEEQLRASKEVRVVFEAMIAKGLIVICLKDIGYSIWNETKETPKEFGK